MRTAAEVAALPRSGPELGPQYVDYVSLTGTHKIELAVRPEHYGVGKEHEAYKCLRAWGLESDAFLWTVGKYLSRAGKKDELLQELKKMKWYLDMRIESLEGENNVNTKTNKS